MERGNGYGLSVIQQWGSSSPVECRTEPLVAHSLFWDEAQTWRDGLRAFAELLLGIVEPSAHKRYVVMNGGKSITSVRCWPR